MERVLEAFKMPLEVVVALETVIHSVEDLVVHLLLMMEMPGIKMDSVHIYLSYNIQYNTV